MKGRFCWQMLLWGSIVSGVIGCDLGTTGHFTVEGKRLEGQADRSGSPTELTQDDDTSGLAGAIAACQGRVALHGDQTWTLDSGGLTRIYHLHLPSGYDPTRRTPVVLNFHGFSATAAQQAFYSKMRELSDGAGFIAVHPEGTGNQQSWNAGACCGEGLQNSVDDVAFTSAILDQLESKLCIDSSRVFATGMSNGGFMAHRLACDLSSRIAAVAAVAGHNLTPGCNPSRAVPVLHFHGTADTTVPYDGNSSYGWPSVRSSLESWARRDGCAVAAVDLSTTVDSRCESWPACRDGSEVILCTVKNGGHTWPGAIEIPMFGYTSKTLMATDLIWDFFQRHPLP